MVVSLMFAAVLGLQAAPELPGPRECLDDNHTNRCLPEVQAAVREKLGVASIEAEADAGAEIYRAFFVDGYGRDMPAVAFERRRGQGPEAVVYGFDGKTIRAAVSADIWNRVIEEARFADRRLEAPQEEPAATDGAVPPPPTFCLHSWVPTVEMANSRPTRWQTVPVRRRTEDACDGALTTTFAFFLAEQAVKSIPPCEALDPRRQRNHVTQLAACLNLSGDRLAAAELRNAREDFGPRHGLDRTDPGVWRAALGTNGSPTLHWAGETIRTERGRNNLVAEFVAARMRENANLRFVQQSFEGRSSREGVVQGAILAMEGETHVVAPYRQVWVWDPNLSDWMLSEWTVEPFAPVT